MFGLGINKLGSSRSQASATPETLFYAGEEGTFLDFTTSQVYADTLGTDPAEVGEGIAFIDDKSPNDTDATQATSTARPIFRLTSGVYNAEFDLTDDILPITLPAITGGTVALVGLSGIWIEDDWDYAGGTLDIGPTTIAGLPAGILDVVGDLCAVIINDRAWTAAERAGVVAWGKARGAPGVFGLGPELVTNGTFDSDTDGWIITDSIGTFTAASGVATKTATGTGFVTQAFSADIGSFYVMEGVIKAGSTAAAGFMAIRKADTTTGGTPVNVVVGPSSPTVSDVYGRVCFAATAATTYAVVQGNGVHEVIVDNISVRKLELIP